MSVCHGCTIRRVGCHSECKDYADEVAANEAKRAERFAAQEAEKLADDYNIGIMRKYKKGRLRK